MKIAVVGCGAVGSYYGAKLARAGLEVHFLLRSDYEVVRRQGVLIRSPQGDFKVRPKPAHSPKEIGPSDLVLIGLKTTANKEFGTLLPSLVGKETAVLTLQNGLGNEEDLEQLFPAEQIMGGLCFVCLNRLEPGIIQHLAHGQIVVGEHRRWPQPRTHEIAGMFRHAGVPCTVAADLGRAHWEKLVWNIPFNGLGVASVAGYEAVVSGELGLDMPIGPCLPTDVLIGDEKWLALLEELMLEVIGAARGEGYPLEDSLAEKQIELTRSMGAYKASTLLDFERGQPLELTSLFKEPLARAEKSGIQVPRLRRMCQVLEALDGKKRACRIGQA